MKKQLSILLLAFWVASTALFAQTQTPPTYPTECITAQKQQEIQKMPKGCRPVPASYLSSPCLLKHAEAFDDGASYLVPKDILDKYGRALLGRADGQYVMAKQDMNQVLEKGATIASIEQKLGIPAGAWNGKTIVRIDIPYRNLQKLHFRLPSGNEAATNDLWIPGGRLPTGFWEAVLDPIPQGLYKETVLDVK